MKTSFTEILSNKIEIPIIQRDYAQGRIDEKTKKIRKDFLDVIFKLLSENLTTNTHRVLELDFIYGYNSTRSNEQSSFVPIDGQQRLTTLWLLYWFVAVKEKASREEKTTLSNFAYETRYSTTMFCQQLIKFNPLFEEKYIAEEIRNQPWYFNTWDYDQSIQAMLEVLNDIERRYETLGKQLWQHLNKANCPFHFYKLDIDKVGLSDDLYIKMNSRGKALTEFEYFKAGFAEIISSQTLRSRFEKSIDQEWIECIWNLVVENMDDTDENDVAQVVDDCFLNLFNFITNILALKQGISYYDTIYSGDQLKEIYTDSQNLNTLFTLLDAIVVLQETNKGFWHNTFYYDKKQYEEGKTRLFFQHGEVNLLKRCAFYYNRSFSYPEGLLLHACIAHNIYNTSAFAEAIRLIRNLVVNSDNELREAILGQSYAEVESFIQKRDYSVLQHFKTDQINEEKSKHELLDKQPHLQKIVYCLEDSDIQRGSISLFDWQHPSFQQRASKFLDLFDNSDANFSELSNFLLCFGDYSQDNKKWTNLLPTEYEKVLLRKFFTIPGFNKEHFHQKTRIVVDACLDYCIAAPNTTFRQKLDEKIAEYKNIPKDWKFYFISYPSFREGGNQGYYFWKEDNSHYRFNKMKEKQSNGFNWDPFLYEVQKSLASPKLTLEGYDSKLKLTIKGDSIDISTLEYGFLFENANSDDKENILLKDLRSKGLISAEGEYKIKQNPEGLDQEDRIERLKLVVRGLLDI